MVEEETAVQGWVTAGIAAAARWAMPHVHALFEHCAGVGVAASLRCNEEARHDFEKLFGVNVSHVMC